MPTVEKCVAAGHCRCEEERHVAYLPCNCIRQMQYDAHSHTWLEMYLKLDLQAISFDPPPPIIPPTVYEAPGESDTSPEQGESEVDTARSEWAETIAGISLVCSLLIQACLGVLL